MHDQERALVQSLVAVAWADGDFAQAEQDMLRGLLDAYAASPAERAEFEAYAAIKRDLNDIQLAELSAGDRRLLLQHAVLLTFADGKQAASESAFLLALAAHLRIPAAEAGAVIASATERAKLNAKHL